MVAYLDSCCCVCGALPQLPSPRLPPSTSVTTSCVVGCSPIVMYMSQVPSPSTSSDVMLRRRRQAPPPSCHVVAVELLRRHAASLSSFAAAMPCRLRRATPPPCRVSVDLRCRHAASSSSTSAAAICFVVVAPFTYNLQVWWWMVTSPM